jgi:uncharacterized DUF497 family protein
VSFQWDRRKAASNLDKHGVDFADAATVFDDLRGLTMPDPHPDEERNVTIGLDALGRVLVVSWTSREDEIRLISARKATRRERRDYEEENDGRRWDPQRVWIHPQRDPFPGGHRFWVHVDGADLGSRFQLDRDLLLPDASDWLSRLDSIWPGSDLLPGETFDFVLNSIDKIERVNTGLSFAGVCSPFVRAEPAT